MKKLKIILIITFIVIIASCRKSEYIPTPKIDLGKVSTDMSFTSQPLLHNTNTYSFQVKVTPGSKYSVQIADLSGEIFKSQGLVAKEEVETIELNTEKLPKGIYDLIFINIKGDEIKQPLIIR